MYKITVTPTFERDLRQLDRSVVKRIVAKIESLSQNPDLAQPVRFVPKDLIGLCKFRIGDWRVLCWVNHSKKEIALYRIQHRSSVYKDLY